MSRGTEEEKRRAAVHPLDWPDDFGPVKYTDLARFVMHMQAIDRAKDPAEEQALCTKYGYADPPHFRRVQTTFLKYWGQANDSHEVGDFIWKEPEFSQAIMDSMQLSREADAEAALKQNPQLLAPEEGVTLEQYASVCANVAGRNVEMPELQQILARVAMDIPKWERVNKAWALRMSADTTHTVTMAFTKAYTAAGAGQFGAAAQAASNAMSAAPGTAVAGAEPMSMEKYVEIAAQMEAWGRQGKDVHAMLGQVYQMNAGDLSNVGMYWSQRWSADVRLLGRYSTLMDEAKKRFADPDPDADLVY
jgi:hypothetical protein